jgi:aspartate racemase
MDTTTKRPKIGIVSGVGPLAGSDVLSKVFAYAAEAYGAHEDSDYPEVILLNHGIAGVDNTAALNQKFKTEIIETAYQLESWGATIIGIACNTAHAFLPDMTFKPDTQFVNLLDEVAKAAKEHGSNHGLLTSRGIKDQSLYHMYLNEYGVPFTETNDEQQVLLDLAIDKVMAHKSYQAALDLEKVLVQMKSQGINHFIAGCTELPIALSNFTHPDLDIIESNQVLAESLVNAYYTALKASK